VALALAARRPDVVDRVVVAATPAPDEEIPWLEPGERAAIERLRERSPEDAEAELGGRLCATAPDDSWSAEALRLLGARPDELASCDACARARLGEALQAAVTQGQRGLAAEVAGYSLQPWEFRPEAVEAPTLLLYGARDPLAGPAHGRWWEERLPDARLEVVPAAGHLVLLARWARALAHLAPEPARLRVLAGSRVSEPDAGFEQFPAA
jgi:pimeloyl-ACP methyl ester carboxylesterase